MVVEVISSSLLMQIYLDLITAYTVEPATTKVVWFSQFDWPSNCRRGRGFTILTAHHPF